MVIIFHFQTMEKYIYLSCALFNSARYKATNKLSIDSNIIIPLNTHINVNEYKADIKILTNAVSQ